MIFNSIYLTVNLSLNVFSGQKGSLSNNKAALATVTGIVDGTGSFGGAIGQVLIPLIRNHYSWKFVFYLFMILVSDLIDLVDGLG